MEKIMNLLNEALKKSYSPYSGCKVACVLDFSGDYICGVNVENASYGLTNCAERTAIFNAVSNGKDFNLLNTIYLKSNKKSFFTPCGACLQVLSEFVSGDVKVIIFNCDNVCKEFLFKDLMPIIFDKDKLN